MTFFKHFLRDEQGQDLVEYSLLLGFVAVASVALLMGVGGSINTIWSKTSANLSCAAQQGA